MTALEDLQQIDSFTWEVPAGFKQGMRVAARIFADYALLEAVLSDGSLEQLINVACLPGVERYALAMPDIHCGYGFPVGGVAAIRTADGVISPGGIGYDINCGVRLLLSPYSSQELRPRMEDLATQIQHDVPSGVGRGGFFKLKDKEFDQILNQGVKWALKNGMASDHDIEAIEERGSYAQACAEYISEQAKARGCDQLGTLGAGNHFVEIQKVEEIFNAELAEGFGLAQDQVCVMIHTGSRGLGHQTCTDYVKLMNKVMPHYGIKIPDRELACAPYSSNEGRQYLGAMAAAANFAWTNRQVISHQVRNAFKRVLKQKSDLRLLYDVSHNIAKIERYFGKECVVHRKGATRSFGPGAEELGERYKALGQPVIIPGSMGTASYVLAGSDQSMQVSFGTCCHGAGRALSRSRAKKTLDYQQLLQELKGYGVIVRGASAGGLLEEAPQAYKDVDRVVQVVEQAGIAKAVVRLRPVAVVKG